MLLFRFIYSLIKWLLKGGETRNRYRIRYIYDHICKPCGHFKPGESEDAGSCGVCGCNLKRKGVALNKIAWKTEKCPLNPPRWK